MLTGFPKPSLLDPCLSISRCLMFVISTVLSFLFRVSCCWSVLFFVHFSVLFPGQIVRFLISSFPFCSCPPPMLLSFSLSPPTCPRVSGLAPVTLPLHYITATYNTLISLRTPRGFPPAPLPLVGTKICSPPIGRHSTWIFPRTLR